MKVVILGATGYTGLTLLRGLLKHPKVTQILPVSSSNIGTKVSDFDSGLSDKAIEKKIPGLKFISLEDGVKEKPMVAFAALPHLKSAEILKHFIGISKIIDLSADFRIEDNKLFNEAYGQDQPAPELQEMAVYGLSEWYTEKIKEADLIANPGCYPTATLLPILPLLKENLIKGDIVTNALSGISGAGRGAKPNSMFFKRDENTNAYAPGRSHRHYIEIKKEMDYTKGVDSLLFTPHLVPLRKGMIVTSATTLNKGVTAKDVESAYSKYYKDKPFINLIDGCPESAAVTGSNRCDISFHIEEDKLILMSAIDNLQKGASGQAIQNMNIIMDFPEELGLEIAGEL